MAEYLWSANPGAASLERHAEWRAARNALSLDLHQAVGFAADGGAAMAGASAGIADGHRVWRIFDDKAGALLPFVAQLDELACIAKADRAGRSHAVAVDQLPLPLLKLREHGEAGCLRSRRNTQRHSGNGRCKNVLHASSPHSAVLRFVPTTLTTIYDNNRAVS